MVSSFCPLGPMSLAWPTAEDSTGKAHTECRVAPPMLMAAHPVGANSITPTSSSLSRCVSARTRKDLPQPPGPWSNARGGSVCDSRRFAAASMFSARYLSRTALDGLAVSLMMQFTASSPPSTGAK
eukprot:4381320-Amphidinium_carterae.1